MKGGLGKLFTRIIPLVTLICFICFGITYAIATPSDIHLTYLTEEYYDTTTYEKIYNPTEEQKLNADKVYNFDMASYVKNIDPNLLRTAAQNIINFKDYTDAATGIEETWQDGYQLGDISKTIANAVILAINTIILIINIILYPIRVIAGITLTAMSLIGINISQGFIIIPFLKTILNNFHIRFIQKIGAKPEYDSNTLNGTSWYLGYRPTLPNGYRETELNINFESNGKQFNKIVIAKTIFGTTIIDYYYADASLGSIRWYKNGYIHYEYSNITITGNNYTPQQTQQATQWLETYYLRSL